MLNRKRIIVPGLRASPDQARPLFMREEKWDPKDSAEERDLVRLAREGNGRALDRLLTLVRPAVVRICFNVLKDPDAAGDAASETLIKVWKSIHKLKSSAAFRSWLVTTATRTATDLKRKSKNHFEVPLNEFSADRYPAYVEEDSSAIVIDRVLFDLSPGERTAIMLAYEGATAAEIAEVLQCAKRTAEYKLHAARDKIKRHFPSESSVSSDAINGVEIGKTDSNAADEFGQARVQDPALSPVGAS